MVYQFDTTHAEMYGVDEAILLHNIIFWIMKNKANGKGQHRGRTWTYSSAKAYTKLFPFWNRKKISRLLLSLEDQGALVSGNFNKVGYDRTKWYSLYNEEEVFKNWSFDCPNSSNRNSDTVQPIPDTSTDNKKKSISRSEAGDKQSSASLSKATPRFKPPTITEIADYILEYSISNTLGYSALTQREANRMATDLYDFYESKDWKVGKQKMSKWKNCASRWFRNNQEKKEVVKRRSHSL